MTDYLLSPGMDEKYNFHPDVRKAFAESSELTNKISAASLAAVSEVALEADDLLPDSPKVIAKFSEYFVDKIEDREFPTVDPVTKQFDSSVQAGIYEKSVLNIYDVTSRGVVPNTGVDQAPAIQVVIDAAPAGANIHIPAGDYVVSSSLRIDKKLTFFGEGQLIATHDNALFVVAADDVFFDGDIKLKGRQRTVWVSTARGISVVGTPDTPIKGFRTRGLSLTQFGGGGVVQEFSTNTRHEKLKVTKSTYYGVAMLSEVDAVIKDSTIIDINTGGLPNSYGVTASRRNGTLAQYGRSTDVTVMDSYISDVPDWVGFDTHGGIRISSIRNRIVRCKRGIDFVASVGASGQNEFAPLDFVISDNFVDNTGIPSSHGIGGSGATGTPGSYTELATGRVSGNTVIRSGDSTNNSLGGLWFRGTLNLIVSNNRVFEPGSHGVCFVSDNYGFVVEGLNVVDPWSNDHTLPSAIAFRSTYNFGVVSSFSSKRGTKVATNVGAYGAYLSDAGTTSSISFGTAISVDSGVLIAEATGGRNSTQSLTASKVNIGRNNGLLGHYGGTPVAIPTGMPAAATDAATNLALTNFIRKVLLDLTLAKA